MLLALQTAFIDGIGFDPFFRGLLSVLTAILVLIGGTYLVLATDTGSRLGFLVAASGLFGWLFLMGIVWTIYGIGWKGDPPTWSLVEINFDDAADNDDGLLFSEVALAGALAEADSGDGLPTGGLGDSPFALDEVLARLDGPDAIERARQIMAESAIVETVPDPDLAQEAALVASRTRELDEWRYLVTSDAIRGEAQASVDAFLVSEGVFEVGGYIPSQFGAFIIDGKPQLKENANLFDRVAHTLNESILNPYYTEELIVLQVRGATDQATLPGQPPPVAAVDPEAPLVSVIMERDRGGPIPALFSGLRFTPAMFTVFNGLIFAALAWNMHVRDQREVEVRTAAA